MNPAPSERAAGSIATIDHLVVFAHDLEQGAEWCGDLFGVSPGPGGSHRLMGTHNRLLKIGAADWPQAYLEIIAIDPASKQPPAAGRARWFGIDDPGLRRLVEREPRLVHYVANCNDLQLACSRLAALGEDVGMPVAASRRTADGELRWQITLRADGVPQHGGALPALIGWQGRHPSAAMADQGVRLSAMRACSPRPQALRQALGAIGLVAVEVPNGDRVGHPLEAVFDSPRGVVSLYGGQLPPRSGSADSAGD